MLEKNKTLPLISIIVPVYNVKDYLEKCLKSICGQTYQNLEIIVVDDGSTDGSGELCDVFAQSDSRIKVVHQSNGGVSAARNKAISVAQGEYLGFVDSDDWIDNDMYEFLYQLMIQNEADVAISSLYIEKESKTVVKYASENLWVYNRDEAIRALVEDKHVRNYLCDKLFKRYLFEGISFPLNRIFEDLAVSYQLFYKTKKVVMQDTPKYHYLMRAGSAMQSKYNPLKEHNLFQAVYEQVNFVLDKGIWDKAGIYVVRRGVHLVDHTLMLAPSTSTDNVVKDVLAKMHEFDQVKNSQLGISYALKRYCIYHCMPVYRTVYRMIRTVFKSKRHKY